MTIETELKLLLSAADRAQLINQLNNYSQSSVSSLDNHYYDTPSFSLRKLGFGLRVRFNGQAYQQTIKTAGKVNNGLHSRPEYNIDINCNYPNVFLFPEEIWPKNINLAELQDNLQILFSTNFQRQAWLINLPDGQIEAALDFGKVICGEESLDICELELELMTGDPQLLFSFAKIIANWIKLTPSDETKAQRGYQLALAKR